MAWAVSKAWKARKVTLSRICASAVVVSRNRSRKNTGSDCERPGPISSRATSGSSCDASTPITAAGPEPVRRPGRIVQPATASSNSVGATRLRRRLSRIFQRPMSGSVIALQAAARRHERKQPEEDLPVAANPAVLPSRVRQHARRVVVDELDVRHQRDPRVQPLEQIVREQRVLRHRIFERRGERVDVVQALAGEDAFAEQVLIGVGDGGRVRIDASVAGVEAREQRSRRAHVGHADPRLQDAVAFDDAAGLGIEAGPIQRMGDDADQHAWRHRAGGGCRCRA